MNKEWLTRRSFLQQATLLGATWILPRGLQEKNYYQHGVASGDPLQDQVIIWTRISNADLLDMRVIWEIAADDTFTKIVQTGKYNITPAQDYTVKIDVTQLHAGQRYYYRFKYKGAYSATGTTQTLPEAIPSTFNIAVVACNNYEDGYFNAFRYLSQKEEVDLVLHLGDYIYEYKTGEYSNPAVSRTNAPLNELLTLQDYRQRYAHYRSDMDLQALHKAKPFLLVWDDHEFANDAYRDGAKNNQPGEAVWEDRKNAAMQAYFEWLPVRAKTPAALARKISIGKDIDILLMDQRLTGRTKQTTIADPAFFDAGRSLLGKEQLTWFLNEMEQSKAVWRLVANQVMFTGYNTQQDAKEPKSGDWWLGYPAERKTVMEMLQRSKQRNTVFLTGDHHQSFVLALHNDEYLQYKTPKSIKPLAWEFLTPSITSKNLDRLTPQKIAETEKTLMDPAINPHMQYADTARHGYYIAAISKEKITIQYYYAETILQKESKELAGPSYQLSAQSFLLEEKN
jgi:alkaline phosphatase D